MRILSVILLPQAPKVNDPEDLKRYIRQLHKVLDEFHSSARDNVSEIETDVAAAETDIDTLETAVTEIKIGEIVFTLFCNSGKNLTGVRGILRVPFACTITDYYLLANKNVSVVIDIWKDTYANFPPTDADSITASAPPTLTGAAKAKDTTLTGWTKTIAADDILFFNVDSATVSASEAYPAIINLTLKFERN